MRSIYRSGAFMACALLLFACSGGAGTAPSSTALVPSTWAPRADGPVAPDACTTAKIYVADYLKNYVEIYSQGITSPKPCGKISTGISAPEAIAVDTKGKVYVANYLSSTVTEYKGGKLKLTITTGAPGYDLFVGANKTLYVAEPTAEQVEEYAAGATSPFLTLSINGGPHGVATDAKNNLYVAYLSNTDGVSHVEKFKPKATTGTDLGFTVGFSGELKLDSANDIIIGDRNSSNIYIYPPGQIVPSRSFPTPGGKPVNFALNNPEALLYVSGLGSVGVFDYQTGTQIDSISSGLRSPSGVALYPPAPY